MSSFTYYWSVLYVTYITKINYICNVNITVHMCVFVRARTQARAHIHTKRRDPRATHTTHFSTAEFLFYKYPVLNTLLR